jgi:hypothetical protein
VVSHYRHHPQAEKTEREITEYLKQLQFFIVPAANYSQGGAPMVEGASKYNSIVMPDQIGMRGGRMTAFDVKWKSNAFPWRNASNRLVTGIDENSYAHYRRFERESGMHVVIVFCHEKEGDVRCATLDRLDENRAPNGPADAHGKGGMRNWWYSDIPSWMSLTEMRLCVRDRILKPTELPSDCWPAKRSTPIVHHRPDPQQSLFSNLGSMTRDIGETDPLKRSR